MYWKQGRPKYCQGHCTLLLTVSLEYESFHWVEDIYPGDIVLLNMERRNDGEWIWIWMEREREEYENLAVFFPQ